MIKSLTFTGESGYITSKIPEPNCSVRGYGLKGYFKRHYSDDEMDRIKKYKKEHRYWARYQKDKYMYPEMVQNLIGRKFEFEAGKINLIFGPNASGKTTILKALAGKAGTSDGYTQLLAPLDIASHFYEEMSDDLMKRHINNMMLNSAEIEWDGTPVYYDNFANRKNYGHLGDLGGSVLGNDIMTEMLYILEKNKISLGQNSIYLMNRLFKIAENRCCYADFFRQYLKDDGSFKKPNQVDVNDAWYNAYKVQMKYYLGFEKAFTPAPVTMMFDEIDKSLDIANIFALYTEVLPQLVKETGVQVITISHSPLVLSDDIFNNEMYNVISIDEAYTAKCREVMKKLF